MGNFIVTVILLAITLFVINLFPMGREFLGSIVDTFNEKRTNVMQEYEDIKGTVDKVTGAVTETKDKVDTAVTDVNKAVKSVQDAADSANKFLGDDSGQAETGENPSKTAEKP